MVKNGFQMCNKCCGCGACASICPKNAISMKKNLKGFLYPKLEEKKCIECGLCIKVCPLRKTQ